MRAEIGQYTTTEYGVVSTAADIPHFSGTNALTGFTLPHVLLHGSCLVSLVRLREQIKVAHQCQRQGEPILGGYQF